MKLPSAEKYIDNDIEAEDNVELLINFTESHISNIQSLLTKKIRTNKDGLMYIDADDLLKIFSSYKVK